MLLIEDVVEQEFDRVSDFDTDLNFDEDRPTDGGLLKAINTLRDGSQKRINPRSRTFSNRFVIYINNSMIKE